MNAVEGSARIYAKLALVAIVWGGMIGAALVVSGVFIINRAPAAAQTRHAPAHTG